MNNLHEKQLLSLEMRISKFLRVGVIVAALVMLIGWVGTLVRMKSGFALNRFTVFETYHHVPLFQELNEAIQLGNWPKLISYLGLVILISLPISRVLLTMILFFKQKEKILGWVALFVLVALAMSLLLGFEL
jgi:uncharacterized membrane protein